MLDTTTIDAGNPAATDPAIVDGAIKEPTVADTGVKDAAVDKPASQTILDATDDDGKVTHPADWPEDWKERAVKSLGGDDKMAGWIKRYGSLPAALKAGYEASQKIRTGEFKKPLSADATPEEKAAWRKEQGIPETAEDYTKAIQLGDVIPGEAEKPLIGEIATVAHELDIDPGKTSKIIQKYYELQDRAAAQQAELDARFKQDAIVELRTELGTEFRTSMTGVANFLEGKPALRDAMLGRGPDGNTIMNNPAVMRELIALVNENNPESGLVPVGTRDAGKAINDRLAELDRMYTEDYARYSREGLEKEHMKLLEANQKIKGRQG